MTDVRNIERMFTVKDNKGTQYLCFRMSDETYEMCEFDLDMFLDSHTEKEKVDD